MEPYALLAKYGYIAKSKPGKFIGDIFSYEVESDDKIGIMFVAELLVKFKLDCIASLLMFYGSHNFLLTIPSKTFTYGFQIDKKLDSLYEKDTSIVISQYENRISKGDYVAIKIPFDGNKIIIYNIFKNKDQPEFLTEIDFDILNNYSEMIKTAFAVVIGELDAMKIELTSVRNNNVI